VRARRAHAVTGVTARRLVAGCALAAVLAAAAVEAARDADPGAVTIAATRDWGPFTALAGHAAVPGRTTAAWLRGARLPAHPSVLVNSAAGEDARVAVARADPQPAGMPAGFTQYVLTAAPATAPGRYAGRLPIGAQTALGVADLVADARDRARRRARLARAQPHAPRAAGAPTAAASTNGS